MKISEFKEYWRWKIVRQVSTFINDPTGKNRILLLEMIQAYAKVHCESGSFTESAGTEPAPVEFVCTVDY